MLRRVVEERAFISVINRRQRVWLGHTLRHGDLIPLVIERRIIGRGKLEDQARPRAGKLDKLKDSDLTYQSRGAP